jgi:hypothetical protein
MNFGAESDDANSGNNTVMGVADVWATDYRRGDVSDRLLRDRGYPRVLQMTKGKGRQAHPPACRAGAESEEV